MALSLKNVQQVADSIDMRISTGISEISFINRSGVATRVPEKVYIWPVYAEGRVEPIQGVARRTDGSAIYSKPLPEDAGKLLESMNTASVYCYGENGHKSVTASLPPGTFFDALA